MLCSCNSNSPFWNWWLFTVRYQKKFFPGEEENRDSRVSKIPLLPRSQQNCTLTLKPKASSLETIIHAATRKAPQTDSWNVEDGTDGIVWQGGIIQALLHNKIFLIESPRDYGTPARKCHRSCSCSVSLSDHITYLAPGKGSPPRPELVPKFAADDRFKAFCRQMEMHSCDLSLFLEFEFPSLMMRGIKFEPEPAPHSSASLFPLIVCRFRLTPQFVKADRPKNTNDSSVRCFSVVPREVVDCLFVTVFNFPVLHKLSWKKVTMRCRFEISGPKSRASVLHKCQVKVF